MLSSNAGKGAQKVGTILPLSYQALCYLFSAKDRMEGGVWWDFEIGIKETPLCHTSIILMYLSIGNNMGTWGGKG